MIRKKKTNSLGEKTDRKTRKERGRKPDIREKNTENETDEETWTGSRSENFEALCLGRILQCK